MSQPAAAAAAIRLQGVGKRFGDHWAVEQVDLDIQRGEFFTFLGPSGCGKTTLLRLVAGFLHPDTGTIYFDDERVNGVPPWQRQVGLVFQNLALWPHLSVFENVVFGLRQRRVPRAEAALRVRQALARVDLTGLEQRRPAQLSGGQQQRVALARTLVVEPRALLLDEPLSSLDARLRLQMRHELARLQRDLGITTIYVTHDQEEALAMSTRIAVLERGQVLQVGTPQQVYQSPVGVAVAGFVGVSNFLPGTLRRLDAAWADVEVAGLGVHRVRTGAGLATAAAAGQGVVISVRPEALSLDRADAGQVNEMTGRVRTAAYLGARVQYEVEAGTGVCLKVDAMLAGTAPLAVGATVRLQYAPHDAVLLPAAAAPGRQSDGP